MSTSFSSRQRKKEARAAESRKQSLDLDENSERPSELDLHPSAVRRVFLSGVLYMPHTVCSIQEGPLFSSKFVKELFSQWLPGFSEF